MNEFQGDDYKVTYDPTTATVTCQGAFRLYGEAGYESLAEVLDQVADQRVPLITLNLKELEFLNSSGVNTISKFIIKVRNDRISQVLIIGNPNINWQMKSLKNLQRLMPTLQVRFE